MTYQLLNEECLESMSYLPPQSVDMVLADLPYGTTQNKWDSVIPLDLLWEQYNRVCKGAVVLTAAQPFTSALVMSNPGEFKYDWIWEKAKATGHLNSKIAPLRAHESVIVFNRGIYNPQKTKGAIYTGRGGKSKEDNYGNFKATREGSPDGSRFPRSVQWFLEERKPVHPTQKPVALMEYLIKTYTNPGDTVLDNTMGSGTTGVACMNTGRSFIGMEKDIEHGYFQIAEKRIRVAYELNTI